MPGEENIRFVYHDTCENRIFCKISDSGQVKRKSVNIPYLHNKEVIYSSNDGRLLLLLHRNNNGGEAFKMSIWNRITDESTDLPDGPDGVKFDKGQTLISSSLDDPNHDCLTVYLFREDSPSLLYCRVDKSKDWCEYNYAASIEAQRRRCEVQLYSHICGRLHQPVSVNGRVYAFYTCGKNLVQISVDATNNCTTNVLLRKMKKKEVESVGCFRNYLVPWEDRDNLYRIKIFLSKTRAFKFCDIPNIQVMRFDFEKNDWRKLDGLEGKRIFLGNRYSLISSSSPATEWSFIYFTSEDHQVLHSYRLEDEKMILYSPYSPDLPAGSWLPYWIMPTELEPEPMPDLEPEPEGDIHEYGKTMVKESIEMQDLIMPELKGLIAENLSSFVDYIYFFSTNIRGWNDIRRTRKNVFQPCLIYRDKVNSVYHITDGNMNRQLAIKIPEDLKFKKISCSRDGWLLVYNHKFCALFNPFTSQLVRAQDPPSKRKSICGVSNFTFIGNPSPFSPQKCSILAMSLISNNTNYLVRSKSSNINEPEIVEFWRLALKMKNFSPSCSSPVLWGEDWYHLGCNGRLGRLRITDLKEKIFEWEVEAFESPCELFTRNYLTECGGEMVSVFIGDSWVRVFKINTGVDKKWQEIDSLGGYCLYVGRPSSMSCVAETLELADRIYFPKFYRDGLVYYSLRSKKYHSIGNDRDEVTKFHPTTMFSDCAWINPNLSG